MPGDSMNEMFGVKRNKKICVQLKYGVVIYEKHEHLLARLVVLLVI